MGFFSALIYNGANPMSVVTECQMCCTIHDVVISYFFYLHRDEIVEAVQEVRKINKGVLSGLAISSIEEKTSAILRRSLCCAGQEKH